MESLHKLKKMMCRELDEISNKGDMSAGGVAWITGKKLLKCLIWQMSVVCGSSTYTSRLYWG